MKRLSKQGFSMIELLVVLLIIGILAAVAAPLFLANSTKAKVSEAVAGAGSIRSAERNYDSQNGAYLAITSATVAASYFGTVSGNQSSVLGVQIHGNKYFSPDSYTIATTGLAWGGTVTGVTLQTPIDFLITVNGTNSVALSTADPDGAANNTAVSGFEVQMDNSGQTIYSTNSGSTWSTF
jgi:prepilin-type N-terminal cleavage/methylation domain-containing protein